MSIPLYEELDPSPADIAIRICELENDEFVITPSEDICLDDYGCFRLGLEYIMNFICAELPLEDYDGDESDTTSFPYDLSIIHDIVCDWLCSNIGDLLTFAAITNRIHVEHLQNGAYKITSLSKIGRSVGTKYIPYTLPPAEMKKRKMVLAALAALRHERSAEIAYRQNDMAAFAVHFSYMWRSYARLATYPAAKGFRVPDLRRILKNLSVLDLSAASLVEGLHHGNFELHALRKSQVPLKKANCEIVRDPYAYVIGSLFKSGYYRRPKGYVSPAEQAEKDAEEEARRIMEARKKREEAEFEVWCCGLTPEEKTVILRQYNGSFASEEYRLKVAWEKRTEKAQRTAFDEGGSSQIKAQSAQAPPS